MLIIFFSVVVTLCLFNALNFLSFIEMNISLLKAAIKFHLITAVQFLIVQ